MLHEKLVEFKKEKKYKEGIESILSLNDYDYTASKLQFISDFTEFYNDFDDEETFFQNYLKFQTKE